MTVEMEFKVIELLFVAVSLTIIFVTASILIAQHFVPLMLYKWFHRQEEKGPQE